MRIRLLLSLTIGTVVSLASMYLQSHGGGNDLWLAHCAARSLVAGSDPYACPNNGWPSNPLPTAMILLPVAWLPLPVAGAIVAGISFGLLTYALIRDDQYWRLLALLSLPSVVALFYVQWSPLLLAAALMPALVPIGVIKPQIGLPLLIHHATPRRWLAAALFVLLSLLILPDWPWRWLPQIRSYGAGGGFIPLLVLPAGPVLLLALLRWRDPRARLLLLLAMTPQRLWYDQLMLWALPQSWREMALLTVASWVVVAIGTNMAAIICIYLPALILTLKPMNAERYRRNNSLYSTTQSRVSRK